MRHAVLLTLVLSCAPKEDEAAKLERLETAVVILSLNRDATIRELDSLYQLRPSRVDETLRVDSVIRAKMAERDSFEVRTRLAQRELNAFMVGQ